MAEIPELRTRRLVLRGFRADDWNAMAVMNADDDFRRFLGGEPWTRARSWTAMEAALGQWALRGYGLFAVEADGVFAGRVGVLHPAEWQEPELAWGIATPFWGIGFAPEAAIAARDWYFDQFGMARLVSYIVPDNIQSARVAGKLGAVRDGTVTLGETAADRWVHRKA